MAHHAKHRRTPHRPRHARPAPPLATRPAVRSGVAALAVAAFTPAAAAAATPGQAARQSRPAATAVSAYYARQLVARTHAAPAMTAVRVHPGDTLSSLAHRLWGHADRWPLLWWANRHQVHNPNALLAGLVLRVPADPAVPQRIINAAYSAIPPPPPPPPPPVPAAPVAAPMAPAAPAPAAPPAPAPAPAQSGSYSAAPGSFQQCVIAAESGGNASAVNPSSGAGGLYGFLPSTWQALGHSGLPENASVSEQNAAFAQEYAQGGTSAWAPYDGC